MWFTESGGVNKIGRIPTTGGTPTEYTVPWGSYASLALIVGADGKLYFNDQSGYEIVPGSPPTINSFTVPQANSLPNGLTLGPDNAIWFLEQTGFLGRVH